MNGAVKPMPNDADVVIVGGGPVGMAMASELGLQGIRVIVLEQAAETLDQPKAGTLHARTVQSLDRRGYLQDAKFRHDQPSYTGFHFAGMPGLTIAAPAGEAQPIVEMSQANLERFLERKARERGVDVRRRHRVLDVFAQTQGVAVRVAAPHGDYVLHGGWVVGCDGARSLVRESAGIESDCHAATLKGLLARARVRDPAAVPRGWHRTPRGWLLFNLHPFGHSRVISFDFSGPDAYHGEALEEEEFSASVAYVLGRPVAMDDCNFLSRFSDFSRLARRYRQGRVLLAGDAAHIHFPVGGQGMNLGVQDAFNLAWKLAAVVHGADAALLDSYDEERRPPAARVISNTRAQMALMNPSPVVDPLRQLMGDFLAVPELNAYVAGMISGQDVHYRHADAQHAEEGSFAINRLLAEDGMHADLRAALVPGRPVLVLFAGAAMYAAAAAAWADTLEIVCACAAEVAPYAAMLVRPDGYIGWIGHAEAGSQERLRSVLAQWFGLRKSQASARIRVSAAIVDFSRNA